MTNKPASLPTFKFHYAKKDCQSGLGITSSSYWKVPKISTALTSPSGNMMLLLQGTKSSHPYVLLAPSALSPSGNQILNPHRCTQNQCLYPADSLTPGPGRNYWAAQSNLSVCTEAPNLGSVLSYSPWDQNWVILCSEFYFEGYIVLIGMALRMIFANWYYKVLLPSPAAIRCKGHHMDGGSGSPA